MRFLIGFVIVLGLAAGIGLSAGTGDAPPAREPSETPEAQIGPWVEEAEPELLTKLAEAEAAAAEERWGDAALTWQQILDTAPPRLVKVRADTPNTFCDVREAIRIRLSTLPPVGLAAYRRASDPAAEKRFTEALTDPRDAPLADVWRRYAITSFGPRALLVLADRALRRGDLDVAIARLETLAYYLDVAPKIDRAGILLRRAWCRARRGERYELSILQREAKAFGETEISFRGRTTTVAEAMEAISRPDETDPAVDGWPLPGGSADRNRRARISPNQRWNRGLRVS